MNEEFPPTELTVEDIDNYFKKLNDVEIDRPFETTSCTSCGEKILVQYTDYFTGQCHDCFCNRKPWCSTSPIRDAYFQVTDA